MMDMMLNRSRGWLPRAMLLLTLAGVAACSDGGAEGAPPADEHEEGAPGDEHAEEKDVVVLDSTAIAVARIALVPVETVQTTALPVTGTITYDANRVSQIGPRTDGRVVALRADVGERVRAGQALAVLESPQVGQLRAEDEEAEALLRIALENYEREVRLEAQGISSRKEVLEAQAELRRAEAAERSAAARLNALGAGHGNGEGSRFAVTAPFPGVIVEREASLGEMASPADRLFTVANLDRVWIELDIYERDLSRISLGQDVEVTTAAYPRRSFPGQIVYVGDILDPQTRTVRARVEIPNESGALKPGMFATARIQVGGGGAPVAVVPQEAVQELEGRKVVFVAGDRPGEFRAQLIEVGERADSGRVIVLSGLQGGERVVTSGAFALRSELAEGEIGGHGH